MRLEAIRAKRDEWSGKLQIPPDVDSSQFGKAPHPTSLTQKLAHRLKYHAGLPVLRSRQGRLLQEVGCPIPIEFDLIYSGLRFGGEAAEHQFDNTIGRAPIGRVLVIGCSSGYETEAWLKRGPRSLTGVDLYSYKKLWNQLARDLSGKYRCPVEFHQSVCERLPFPDGSFDLIHSLDVMEHVRNPDMSMREMTRVLAPGGIIWHQFGPLYFTHGGDHCIGAYGPGSGYDHILLDDAEYRHRINDVEFFKTTPEPDCRHWAAEDQFSFLTAKDYLGIFERYTAIESVIATISAKGLQFRREYNDKWRRMLEGGMAEHDLLLSALHVIMRKSSQT